MPKNTKTKTTRRAPLPAHPDLMRDSSDKVGGYVVPPTWPSSARFAAKRIPSQVAGWYEQANKFVPESGCEYEWLWDYAQFHLTWASALWRYVEGKAFNLFKLNGVMIAAAWALFQWMESRHAVISPALTLTASAAGVLLAGSLMLLVLALKPQQIMLPPSEAQLLTKANAFKKQNHAAPPASLMLAASAESFADVAGNKGTLVLYALVLSTSALIMFILGFVLSLAVHL